MAGRLRRAQALWCLDRRSTPLRTVFSVQAEYKPTWAQSGDRPAMCGQSTLHTSGDSKSESRSRHDATRIMASTCVAYVKYPDFDGRGATINAPWYLGIQNVRSLELAQTAAASHPARPVTPPHLSSRSKRGSTPPSHHFGPVIFCGSGNTTGNNSILINIGRLPRLHLMTAIGSRPSSNSYHVQVRHGSGC